VVPPEHTETGRPCSPKHGRPVAELASVVRVLNSTECTLARASFRKGGQPEAHPSLLQAPCQTAAPARAPQNREGRTKGVCGFLHTGVQQGDRDAPVPCPPEGSHWRRRSASAGSPGRGEGVKSSGAPEPEGSGRVNSCPCDCPARPARRTLTGYRLTLPLDRQSYALRPQAQASQDRYPQAEEASPQEPPQEEGPVGRAGSRRGRGTGRWRIAPNTRNRRAGPWLKFGAPLSVFPSLA
jgi:hypothetical protein